VISDPSKADVVIVNTCAFVDDAKSESISAIIEAAQLKAERSSPVRGLFVTGCMAQRYSDDLATELPEVDAVVGFEHYSDLPQQVHALLARGADEEVAPAQVFVGSASVPFRSEETRVRLTASHTAYLRVAEGCDHACTFCAIPGFRGKFRSKPFNIALAEATRLVESGVREINLIAEDTNQYGSDWGEQDGRRLADFLHALAELPGLRWIRLLYCYPSYFSPELVDAIAGIDKVVKYIDIPLQHLSPTVLQRMRRPPASNTLSLLRKLRERVPSLTLRTAAAGPAPEGPPPRRMFVGFGSRDPQRARKAAGDRPVDGSPVDGNTVDGKTVDGTDDGPTSQRSGHTKTSSIASMRKKASSTRPPRNSTGRDAGETWPW
jgi:ribosomal protein S12 methylthiotransferase